MTTLTDEQIDFLADSHLYIGYDTRHSGHPEPVVEGYREFARALLSASIADTARAMPVAWRHNRTFCLYETEEEVPLADGDEWAEPLYLAAPPASSVAEPTDGQLDELFMEWNSHCHGGPVEAHRRFARQVLALVTSASSVADAAGASEALRGLLVECRERLDRLGQAGIRERITEQIDAIDAKESGND